VFVIDVASGRHTRLGAAQHHEMFTAWSSDGERLYYSVDHGDGWQVWRMGARGGGRQLVTPSGFSALLEERGGEHLYYLRAQDPSIWRLAPVSGEEERVVGPDQMSTWYDYAMVEDGVYAVSRTTEGTRLVHLHLSTGELETLRPLPVSGECNLAVSPDGRWVLFDRMDRSESDLMLVEGF